MKLGGKTGGVYWLCAPVQVSVIVNVCVFVPWAQGVSVGQTWTYAVVYTVVYVGMSLRTGVPAVPVAIGTQAVMVETPRLTVLFSRILIGPKFCLACTAGAGTRACLNGLSVGYSVFWDMDVYPLYMTD